ncbi:hypothetical protein LLG95_09985 [bacterium]|nr:hypothetical protein [bacterium]
MPQMHFYIREELAKKLRERARARGLSMSRYLASVVRREVGEGWPEGYFEEVIGGWQGKPLRRAPQGKLDKRDQL